MLVARHHPPNGHFHELLLSNILFALKEYKYQMLSQYNFGIIFLEECDSILDQIHVAV